MAELTIQIKAPELEAAINHLADALLASHAPAGEQRNPQNIQPASQPNKLQPAPAQQPVPQPMPQPRANSQMQPPAPQPASQPAPQMQQPMPQQQAVNPQMQPQMAAQPMPMGAPAGYMGQPMPQPVPGGQVPNYMAGPVIPVQTTPPSYTLDQISSAGARLVDAGKQNELLALLAKYGVATLNQINPQQYGIIATELRALGAAI